MEGGQPCPCVLPGVGSQTVVVTTAWFVDESIRGENCESLTARCDRSIGVRRRCAPSSKSLSWKRSDCQTLSGVSQARVQQIHHVDSALVVCSSQSAEEEDEGVPSVASWGVLDVSPSFNHWQIHCVASVVLQEPLVDVDVDLLLLLFLQGKVKRIIDLDVFFFSVLKVIID